MPKSIHATHHNLRIKHSKPAIRRLDRKIRGFWGLQQRGRNRNTKEWKRWYPSSGIKDQWPRKRQPPRHQAPVDVLRRQHQRNDNFSSEIKNDKQKANFIHKSWELQETERHPSIASKEQSVETTTTIENAKRESSPRKKNHRIAQTSTQEWPCYI